MNHLIKTALILSIIFQSCKKQTISPTQGQLMASNLEASLGAKPNVEQDYSIHVLDQSTGNSIYDATSFSISENGFIVLFNNAGGTIYRVTYNLGLLKSYSVLNHTLYLYY